MMICLTIMQPMLLLEMQNHNINFHRGVRYSHMTCDSRDSFPTFPCFEGIYFLWKESNLPIKSLERNDLKLDNKEKSFKTGNLAFRQAVLLSNIYCGNQFIK